MRRTREGYLPFKDDKPKYSKNSRFEASSVLVVKAKEVEIIATPEGVLITNPNYKMVKKD